MELRDLLPGVIGSFVGVMGWLVVGLLIQRRQFMSQARNAAKAVYFELDVNLAAMSVAREHGLFSDLDRGAFERLLPELATLVPATDLRIVVDAYMTHAGYRQMASRNDLPAEVRRLAISAYVSVHERAIASLSDHVFTEAEARALASASGSVDPSPTESAAKAQP